MECVFQTAHEEAAWLSAPRAAEDDGDDNDEDDRADGRTRKRDRECDRVVHGLETARKSQIVSSALPKW